TCGDLDVTRWREDRTCDSWGQFCYVRDVSGPGAGASGLSGPLAGASGLSGPLAGASGLCWSAGYQPTVRPPDQYTAVFSTDKAEFRRLDAGVETHLEITVSPENNAEIRRLTLTNTTDRARDLELTSYAEVVLAPHRADLQHPAFGKLFLETELVPAGDAL